MKDRYLYRAKRKSDKQWFYGNLIQTDDGVYIIQNYVPQHLIENYKVDPSTICQCTGLKDKNGKLIWENDIVELYDRNTDYRWRAIVRFGNPNHEYTWGWQLEPIGECEVNIDILCWIDMEESGAFCEVIGSAIDNLELLEVGE